MKADRCTNPEVARHRYRVLDLDPFQIKIVDVKGVNVSEVKYGNDEKVGSAADKERNDKKAFYVKITTDNADIACPQMRGTISVRSGFGTGETIIEVPADIGYQAKYDLTFSKESGTVCSATVGGKSRFLLSNRSGDSLSNIADTTFIYGGIKPGRIVVEVEQNGAGSSLAATGNQNQKAYAQKQQMQAIVLGIDGLRQDVLYQGRLYDPTGCGGQSCNVGINDLPGFKQILSDEQQYIMLPDVTAIFPSITLASWASIFTGKMPKETGILGNEFFARDLGTGVPEAFNPPAGMITFDSGAFKGFDQYGIVFSPMLTDDSFFVPWRWDWKDAIDPETTPQNKPEILKTATIFETVKSMATVKDYFAGKGGDPVVVAYSHYARGARWLTWGDFALGSTEASILDNSSWARLEKYLDGTYKSGFIWEERNNAPFSALTVWYLPGLDHEAHEKGMGAYKEYFTGKTDDYVNKFVANLKELEEFDNKIFIIVADHGLTAMPTDLKYKDINWLDITVQKDAEISCKLKLNFIDPENHDHITSAQRAEQANNNLHIWELGEMLKAVGEVVEQATGIGLGKKVLAPKEIAQLFIDSNTGKPINNGAVEGLEDANVIAAMNGPMAHIYVKGTDWSTTPDTTKVTELAEILRVMLQGAKGGDSPFPLFPTGMADRFGYKIGRLSNSVDEILVRDGGVYKVYTVNNSTGVPQIVLKDLNSISSQYVDAANRIEKMNDVKRSGDIVLIMKDDADLPQESIENHRYTTGVACKSWHGSLNKSDSYVPLIIAYPGGKKEIIEPLINSDSACPTGCEGNWKVKDLITTIMQDQYGTQ